MSKRRPRRGGRRHRDFYAAQHNAHGHRNRRGMPVSVLRARRPMKANQHLLATLAHQPRGVNKYRAILGVPYQAMARQLGDIR